MNNKTEILHKGMEKATLNVSANRIRRAYYLKLLHAYNSENSTSMNLSDWLLGYLPEVPDTFNDEYADFVAKKEQQHAAKNEVNGNN